MSTSRWRVRCGKGSLLRHFYVYGPNVFKHFTDWHEAQAFAMQQSRTVEVELPPADRECNLEDSYVRAIAHEQVVSLVDMADDESIFVDVYDWRPLGEYLLALHYRNERNKK